MSKSKMHKADQSIEAFKTDDGLWHVTMFCGVTMPLVSGKQIRPWTYVHDHLVMCEECVAKLQRELQAGKAGRAQRA